MSWCLVFFFFWLSWKPEAVRNLLVGAESAGGFLGGDKGWPPGQEVGKGLCRGKWAVGDGHRGAGEGPGTGVQCTGPAACWLPRVCRMHRQGRRLLICVPRPLIKGYLKWWRGKAEGARVLATGGGWWVGGGCLHSCRTFVQKPQGSSGIKGIRVINCISRLQLQHKRNPCF